MSEKGKIRGRQLSEEEATWSTTSEEKPIELIAANDGSEILLRTSGQVKPGPIYSGIYLRTSGDENGHGQADIVLETTGDGADIKLLTQGTGNASDIILRTAGASDDIELDAKRNLYLHSDTGWAKLRSEDDDVLISANVDLTMSAANGRAVVQAKNDDVEIDADVDLDMHADSGDVTVRSENDGDVKISGGEGGTGGVGIAAGSTAAAPTDNTVEVASAEGNYFEVGSSEFMARNVPAKSVAHTNGGIVAIGDIYDIDQVVLAAGEYAHWLFLDLPYAVQLVGVAFGVQYSAASADNDLYIYLLQQRVYDNSPNVLASDTVEFNTNLQRWALAYSDNPAAPSNAWKMVTAAPDFDPTSNDWLVDLAIFSYTTSRFAASTIVGKWEDSTFSLFLKNGVSANTAYIDDIVVAYRTLTQYP